MLASKEADNSGSVSGVGSESQRFDESDALLVTAGTVGSNDAIQRECLNQARRLVTPSIQSAGLPL